MEGRAELRRMRDESLETLVVLLLPIVRRGFGGIWSNAESMLRGVGA